MYNSSTNYLIDPKRWLDYKVVMAPRKRTPKEATASEPPKFPPAGQIAQGFATSTGVASPSVHDAIRSTGPFPGETVEISKNPYEIKVPLDPQGDQQRLREAQQPPNPSYAEGMRRTMATPLPAPAPPPQTPRDVVKPADPYGRAIIDTARSLATPENLALAGATMLPVVGPMVGVAAEAYYTPQMIKGASQSWQAADAADASGQKDQARYQRGMAYLQAMGAALPIAHLGVRGASFLDRAPAAMDRSVYPNMPPAGAGEMPRFRGEPPRPGAAPATPVAPPKQIGEGAPSFAYARAVAPKPSPEGNAPTFYSQLEKVISEKMPNAASGKQVLDIVSNPQNAVKREEIDWSGLQEFLADKPKVTKQEVIDHLQENKVELKDVTKGGENKPSKIQWRNPYQRDGETRWTSNSGGPDLEIRHIPTSDPHSRFVLYKDNSRFGHYSSFEDASEAAGRAVPQQTNTKYDSYSTPGGENYRELLMTLPGKTPDITFRPRPGSPDFIDAGKNWVIHQQGGSGRDNQVHNYALAIHRSFPTVEEAKNFIIRTEANEGKNAFKSGHWDEPNILAHVRLKDFKDSEGKKVLLVEEIQSDWHQKGRKEGYTKDTKGWTAKLLSAPDAGFTKWQVSDANGNRVTDIVGGTEESAIRKAAEGDVPDAPFKKNWHELALKKILRLATEEGYDKIAWTPGQHQAARYDLSKQVTEVNYSRKSKQLIALKGSSEVMRKEVEPEQIEDYIGKELAEKLLSQKHNFSVVDVTKPVPKEAISAESWARFLQHKGVRSVSHDKETRQRIEREYLKWIGGDARSEAEYENATPWRIANEKGETQNSYQFKTKEEADAHLERIPVALRGLDLKIGGEGMKGFYDKIVPQFLDKYVKKWGAKSAPLELRYSAPDIGVDIVHVDRPQEGWRIRTLEDGDTLFHGPAFSTRESAKTYLDNNPPNVATHKMHGLELTPQMKEGVLKIGQPLFARTGVQQKKSVAMPLIEAKIPRLVIRKTRQGETAVVNTEALSLITRIAGSEGVTDALTIPRALFQTMQVNTSKMLNTTPASDKGRRQFLEILQNHITKAQQDGRKSMVFVPGDRSIAEVKSSLRHEHHHATQLELTARTDTDISWEDVFISPIKFSDEVGISGDQWKRITERLANMGYDDTPISNAMEVGAYIASGNWAMLGLGRNEAKALYSNYLQAMIRKNGAEAVAEATRSLHPEIRKVYDQVTTPAKETAAEAPRKQPDQQLPAGEGEHRTPYQSINRGEVRGGVRSALPSHEFGSGSKIVDADSKLKTVYHGSREGDVQFDENRLAYFTSSPEYAKHFGPKISEAHLDIQNPFDAREGYGHFTKDNYWLYLRRSGAEIARLKKAGYDGVIMYEGTGSRGLSEGAGRHEVYVAFSPSQIQSTPKIGPAASRQDFERLRPIFDSKLAAERFARFQKRDYADLGPKNKQVKNAEGVVLAGPVSFAEWQDRVTKTLTPEQIKTYREWYSSLRPLFVQHFGKTGDQLLLAWLLSQKNTSPSGGMMNLQRAIDQFVTKLPMTAKPGLVEAEAGAILTQHRPTSGFGAKLLDFIDSYLARESRNVMGYRSEGGRPVAVDIWTTRDVGFMDDVVKGLLKKQGYDVSKLKRDPGISPKGAPNEPHYEFGSRYMNALTDYLNESGFDGGNWKSFEAQAVGWMAIQKALGVTPEALEAIFDANIRQVNAAVAFGSGSPFEKKYGDRYYKLSPEGQKRVTAQVLGKAIEYAKKKVGGTLVERTDGVGRYGGFNEPSTTLRLLSSPEVAADYHDILGLALQQSEVLSYRARRDETKSTRQLVLVEGSGLKSSKNREAFLDALIQEAPYIQGATLNDEGLRMLNLKGPKWDLEDLGNALERAALRANIDPKEIEPRYHYANVDKYLKQDWSKDQKGLTYENSLKSRRRDRLIRDLHSDRGTFEGWVSDALRKEEGQRGSIRVPAARARVTPVNPETGKPVEASEVDPDAYFNFEKSGLSGDLLDRMRQQVQKTVAEKGPFPKDVVGFQAIRDEAAQIDPSIIDALRPPTAKETLHPAVRLAARNTLNDLNRRTYELAAKVESLEARDGHTPEVERLKTEIAAMDENARRLIEVLYRTRAQDGRNLVYHKIIAQQGFDVDYWVSRVRRSNGGSLPSAQEAEVRAMAAEAQKYTDLAGGIPNVGEPADFKADGEQREGVVVSFGQDGSIVIKDANGVTHKWIPDEPQIKVAAEARWTLQGIRDRLVQMAVKAEKDGWLDTINALRRAGLLTGIRTVERNLVSNALFNATEELAKIPASVIDIASAMFSGQRAILAPGPLEIARLVKAGVVEGGKGALSTLKTGKGITDKYEGRSLNTSILPWKKGNAILNGYHKYVMRVQGAGDQFSRAAAIRASLDEQARLIATNLLKKGKIAKIEFDSTVRNLRENPTIEMSARAVSEGEFAVLGNNNRLSDAWKSLRDSDALVRAVADFIVPFAKVPTNVVIAMLRYTVGAPLTVIRSAIQYRTGDYIFPSKAERQRAHKAMDDMNFKQEQQRAWSLAIGRSTIGLGILYMGYLLFKAGKATPTKLASNAQKNMEEAAGRRPGAVKTGDDWRQISSLWIGNLLTVGASLGEAEKEGAKKSDTVGRVAATAGRVVLDTPMLKGVREAEDTLKNPTGNSLPYYTGSIAGSMIPTMVSDIAGAGDSKVREASGVKEGLMSRLPGLRNKLPARTDIFGRDVEKPTGVKGMVDFTSPSKSKEGDSFYKELLRLGVTIAGVTPQMKPSPDSKLEDEDRETFRGRKKYIGQWLEAALRDEMAKASFSTLSDNAKKYHLQAASAAAREKAESLWERDQAQKTGINRQLQLRRERQQLRK